MNQNLLKNNYLLVRNFIDKDFAQGFKFEEDSALFDSDTQVPGTPSKYNYPPALDLLVIKLEKLLVIVETPVLPTYTYGRVYKEGDELKISMRPEVRSLLLCISVVMKSVQSTLRNQMEIMPLLYCILVTHYLSGLCFQHGKC